MPSNTPSHDTIGSAQYALIQSPHALIALRNGPSKREPILTYLRPHALVRYYPITQTLDNWYWVEKQGGAGWLLGREVIFEDVKEVAQSQPATPYDGQNALWHERSDLISHNTPAAFAQHLQRQAPNLSQVWVKINDGPNWVGNLDRSPIAICGSADLQRWIHDLGASDLALHAWCAVHGSDLEREAGLIAITCQQSGLRSLLLDISAWRGGRETVRPFMTGLRRELPTDLHIGLRFDPQSSSYDLEQWLPFVNSLHPNCDWVACRTTPVAYLDHAFTICKAYNLPIVPGLPLHAPLREQMTARNLALFRYGAAALSWQHSGSVVDYSVMNRRLALDWGSDGPEPQIYLSDDHLVLPTYVHSPVTKQFSGTWGWPVHYAPTSATRSDSWTEWQPKLTQSGRYEIAAFIPTRYASTPYARYTIRGLRNRANEVSIVVNQQKYRNQWVRLGVFDLTQDEQSAIVHLNNKTGANSDSIAFDAIRYRRLIPIAEITHHHISDGYDSPVGTEEQRRTNKIWPDGWLDASPFGRKFFVGTPSEAYHTGADLNYGIPYAEESLPVHAVAAGVVVFASRIRVWGNLIVIRHHPLRTVAGEVLYSRYAHIQNIGVAVGQSVQRGDQIAQLGDTSGQYIRHLHFDLSPTNILERRPNHWPRADLDALMRNYIDPMTFILDNRPD